MRVEEKNLGKFNSKIGTSKAGEWELKTITFEELGITAERFRGFGFQCDDKNEHTFYFDDMKLIKSDYVDEGMCVDGSSSIIVLSMLLMIMAFLF